MAEIFEENEADSFLNYEGRKSGGHDIIILENVPNPKRRISKVAVRAVPNFRALHFDFKKCPYPAMLEKNPGIVWIKDDRVIWYVIYPYYEHAENALRETARQLLNSTSRFGLVKFTRDEIEVGIILDLE